MKRYLPNKPFPSYIFIPGENSHPKKEGGYRLDIPEPVAEKVDPKNPTANEWFLYAVDLFNSHYYWESHVYFEALWNAHGRIGSIADFFKGMIKLGAAGVKISIHQPKNAEDHFLRAKELFNQVMRDEGEVFLGINIKELIQMIDSKSEMAVTFLT